MAANQLRIDGLEELRRALLALPADLVADAATVVRTAANDTARDITAAYGAVRRTGNLQSHVRVDHGGTRAGATSRVVSTARHAYIYERGTVARQWKNGKSTGVMPAANQFIPIAMARRQVMVDALMEVVERTGLTVRPVI